MPSVTSILSHRFLLQLSVLYLVLCWTPLGLAQETDSDMPVGAVGGAVHADPFTGTATTSIPIAVPPGRQGIQPDLALVYGSSNGNGWLGMGWKLEKGVIERQTKMGVDYSGDDYVFRLSGINVELVNIGTDDYRAKVEGGFTRVEKLSATDGKPYFKATDKTGKVFIFGTEPGTRVTDPNDPNKIFRWCLERVEDVHGNYMTLSYTADQGQAYLTQIDYTGHGSTTPTNQIIFHLEDQPTGFRWYVANFHLETLLRLKSIEVRAQNQLVHAYGFTYSTTPQTNRSLLSSVQQYGRDATINSAGEISGGSTFPATTLTYFPTTNTGQFEPIVPKEHTSSSYGPAWQWQAADVNGDGRADSVSGYIGTGSGWETAVALSSGGGSFQALTQTQHVSTSYGAPWTWRMADVNGDGRADSVAGYIGTGSGWETAVALAKVDGTFYPMNQTQHASTSYDSAWTWQMADVNGDGRADSVAGYIGTGSGWETAVALAETDGTFSPKTQTKHATTSFSSDWKWQMADVNGDGQADSVATYIGTGQEWAIRVALSKGDGTFSSVINSAPHAGPLPTGWTTRLSDVNGDGLADAVAGYIGQSQGWETGVALSKGNGTFEPMLKTVHATSGYPFAWQWQLADMNGDGLVDSLATYIGQGGEWTVEVALSKGNGFFASKVHNAMGGGPFPGGWRTQMADVDGDGLADAVAGYIGVNNGWKTNAALSVGDLSKLKTVSNGLGGSTTIAYTPSTLWTQTQLPYPVQVVSAITTDDGNNHVATTTYSFQGGFHHIGEREFRGFNYVKMTGQAGPSGEQTITESWFHQGNDTAVDVNDPNVPDGYLKGTPYEVTVKDGQSNLYTETFTTYRGDDDGLAPFYNPPASVVTNIYDGTGLGKTTRAEFIYDLYGNVTHEYQYGDDGVASDDRTVVRTYDPNTTEWILGLPTSETIYEGLGTGTQLAQTSFYYDGTTSCSTPSSQTQPTKGQLTRVVKWLNTGPNPETRLAYSSHGNVICTRDAKGNMTTMAYDPSGTFATSVSNAKGHTTSTQYYGVNGVAMDTGLYGQVKRVTDPNGAVVSSTYDALGRRLTATQPDGFTTTTSYNNFGTVGSQHVKATSTVNGTPLSTWTFFDGLGRTMTSKRTGTDAKIIVSTTQYDNRGAVTQSSTPYFESGGSPLWSTNTYDPLGRVTKTTNPDDSQGLACFDDWVTVTIDANNHKKRTTRDAYGRVATVQEYTGTHSSCNTSEDTPYSTTTYQYDDLGNLTRLTDTLGNQSLMSYDTLSRKISMTDPDMGTWTYVYDVNGNLTQQTDAKGQQIHFQYDALNRRVQKDFTTQKTLGSGDVVYTYDGSPSYGIGRLQQVTDSIGTTTFSYDLLGRVINTVKVVDGQPYTTQSAYDSLGRVTQLTYPDSSTVTQTYNGPLLETVKEGSTTYASYAGFNALGQPSTVTLGNGVTTTYTYDSQNFRLKTLKTVKGSTTLQDLGYSFDNGGNVISLTDTTHGNQTFNYDDLDRLTSASGSYPAISYSYNQIGNLTHNSQLGTYTYPSNGSARPHAVTAAGGQTYGYDANGNMISGAGRTISYDHENRPISITTTTTSGGGGGSGGSGTAVTEWEFDVGTRVGGHDLHNGSVLGSTTLSQAVSNVPTNGHPVYVRLKSKVGATWSAVDYTYTATGSSAGQQIASPPIGSVLTSALPTFSWNPNGITPDHWYIEIKEAGHSTNLYDSGNIASSQTSHTVTVALPTDGRHLSLRLWSEINGNWTANDFPYVSLGAASSGSGSGVLNSPTPSSVLSGSSVTFAWSDPNSGGSGGSGTPVTDWELDIGTRVGAHDLHNGQVLGSGTLSQAVSNLPTTGHPVYVRLKSKVGATWSAVDYTYTATGSSAGQQLTSPLIGSVLTSALPTFSWNPNGVTPDHWYIEIKEAGQSTNLYDSGNIASSQTSHTVTVALPTDGRHLTVRLWSEINGNWTANDFPYVSLGAASSGGGSGVLNSPTPSSVLSGSSVTFAWSDPNSGGSGGGGGTTTTKTTTFLYDGDGGRVKKTVDDGSLITWTTYIGKLYVCEGTAHPFSCAKMIFSGSQRIAIKQVGSGSTSYFHPDHLGSTSVLTDSNGVSEQDVAYYPYGDTRSNTGTADVPYKYTGKEQDDSTGLYFYEARYYDPVLGRFISADTVVPGITDPQALNPYSYARNNPIIFNDPSGHFFKKISKSIKKGFRAASKALGPAAPYVIGAVAVVAAVYTGGAVSGLIQGAVLNSIVGSATSQVLIGAAIVHNASAIAFASTIAPIVGGAVGGAVGGFLASGGDLTSAGIGAAGGALGGLATGLASQTGGFGGNVITTAGQGVAGGVTAELQGGNFANGFAKAAGAHVLSLTAWEMRQVMIKQSLKVTGNASGTSVGFRGDGFKLGGGRCILGIICSAQKPSLLGGTQGGQGSIFTFSYDPGSIADRFVEAFAGPHDFLNSPYWYDATGRAINHQGLASLYGKVLNVVNVPLSAPFVAGSVVSPSAYSVLLK